MIVLSVPSLRLMTTTMECLMMFFDLVGFDRYIITYRGNGSPVQRRLTGEDVAHFTLASRMNVFTSILCFNNRS